MFVWCRVGTTASASREEWRYSRPVVERHSYDVVVLLNRRRCAERMRLGGWAHQHDNHLPSDAHVIRPIHG